MKVILSIFDECLEMHIKFCQGIINTRGILRFGCLNFNIFSVFLVCLFDLILYVPSTIFQLNRNGSSWVEPVLS